MHAPSACLLSTKGEGVAWPHSAGHAAVGSQVATPGRSSPTQAACALPSPRVQIARPSSWLPRGGEAALSGRAAPLPPRNHAHQVVHQPQRSLAAPRCMLGLRACGGRRSGRCWRRWAAAAAGRRRRRRPAPPSKCPLAAGRQSLAAGGHPGAGGPALCVHRHHHHSLGAGHTGEGGWGMKHRDMRPPGSRAPGLPLLASAISPAPLALAPDDSSRRPPRAPLSPPPATTSCRRSRARRGWEGAPSSSPSLLRCCPGASRWRRASRAQSSRPDLSEEWRRACERGTLLSPARPWSTMPSASSCSAPCSPASLLGCCSI